MYAVKKFFAKHVLEKGTELPIIQVVPGHNTGKTTTIFTHDAENSFKDIDDLLS